MSGKANPVLYGGWQPMPEVRCQHEQDMLMAQCLPVGREVSLSWWQEDDIHVLAGARVIWCRGDMAGLQLPDRSRRSGLPRSGRILWIKGVAGGADLILRRVGLRKTRRAVLIVKLCERSLVLPAVA